jgi:hypothetical protein
MYEECYVLAFSVTPSCRYWWLCGIWIKSWGKTTKHLLFSPILHKISAMAVHSASICLVRDGFNSLVMIYYIIIFCTMSIVLGGSMATYTQNNLIILCQKFITHTKECILLFQTY